MSKEILIGGKATQSEKDIIEKAASIERRSVSNFIVNASLKEAKLILENK